jgi:hypothetical protein
MSFLVNMYFKSRIAKSSDHRLPAPKWTLPPPSGRSASASSTASTSRSRTIRSSYVPLLSRSSRCGHALTNPLQTTLENLRRELDALDKQYAAMMLSGCKTNQKQDERDSCSPSSVDSTTSQAPAMRKYLQATEVKKWYQQDNNRLYRLNAQHMKVESRMGQLLDASEAAKVPLPSVSTTSRQYRIRPLPSAAYAQVIDDATTDVLCFAHSTEKLSTGARVLGWTDQREVRGGTLKFALQKEFGLSPCDLLERSWSIFSNPDEFPKIYGSALDVQFFVLERIDADTMLFYRRIAPPADGTRAVKTVFLLARRPIQEGYLLLFRSIDKDLVHFEEVDGGVPRASVDTQTAVKFLSSEMWVDKYIWVMFYNVPCEPKRCLFHFGGTATTSLWLREVLFVAIRWESMAVGAQFTLTAD